ncbi:hypothetical protein [Nocardia macrotermitis]|uniref:Uncharacterized protein n=1 Tax=Nocardia macrotermitis TaxID=2585198 RepID=A0A7K0D561_9NOCA|nr:hypothetical protein [Nocardia macrotermitis]MQY20870.1 hypothetical protein [Nocardia macrotermitis]
MTDAVRPPVSTFPGPRPDSQEVAPLLSGYLIAESTRAVSVRVSEGTWTFDRADVLGIDLVPEQSHTDTDPAARPVRVRIRSGATADFTRRLRIELTDRPMTLPQQHSPARGDDLLARLTERWARELHLPTDPAVGGITMTRSHTRSFARSDDAMACDSLD